MTSCGDLEDREEMGSSPGEREGTPQPMTLLLPLPKEWGKAMAWLALSRNAPAEVWGPTACAQPSAGEGMGEHG